MYVYYKIGTRSFRLRPPTFLRCKGTSKIRIYEKKRNIFLYRRSYVIVLGSSNPYFIS